MTHTTGILAGYRGRLSGHEDDTGRRESERESRHDGEGTESSMLWFATEEDLGGDAEAVAYALRALIASESHPILERDGAAEAVRVLNVEVSADDHETSAGHKTVSVLLRRLPPEAGQEAGQEAG